MANNKDFLLKNAVEVGGRTKVTFGTITGNNIDLSTGNYFSDTLAADTTYTISNAGDVQSFQVEVTGGAALDVTLATSVISEYNTNLGYAEYTPWSHFISPNGLDLYLTGDYTKAIIRYSL